MDAGDVLGPDRDDAGRVRRELQRRDQDDGARDGRGDGLRPPATWTTRTWVAARYNNAAKTTEAQCAPKWVEQGCSDGFSATQALCVAAHCALNGGLHPATAQAQCAAAGGRWHNGAATATVWTANAGCTDPNLQTREACVPPTFRDTQFKVTPCGVHREAEGIFEPHGECEDLEASWICACDPGWTDATCDSDVDECMQGTHGCDPNALCVNAPGSFACARATAASRATASRARTSTTAQRRVLFRRRRRAGARLSGCARRARTPRSVPAHGRRLPGRVRRRLHSTASAAQAACEAHCTVNGAANAANDKAACTTANGTWGRGVWVRRRFVEEHCTRPELTTQGACEPTWTPARATTRRSRTRRCVGGSCTDGYSQTQALCVAAHCAVDGVLLASATAQAACTTANGQWYAANAATWTTHAWSTMACSDRYSATQALCVAAHCSRAAR